MEETGKKVHRVNETIFHPTYPFLGASLDRRVVGEDALLECKTASGWKSKEWEGEDIPREYEIQVHHQLAVTGKKLGYIAVLLGNQDFKIQTIDRDERLIQDILKKEVEFWTKFVLTGIQPELIMKYDGDTLDALYFQATEGKEVALSSRADLIRDELMMFEQDKKHLEGLIDQHENELKSFIKENEKGVTPLGNVIKWSNSKWSGLDGKTLKAELPDVYAKYFKSKPTRRFTYK
jgi:predicted phage-related endonuclease